MGIALRRGELPLLLRPLVQFPAVAAAARGFGWMGPTDKRRAGWRRRLDAYPPTPAHVKVKVKSSAFSGCGKLVPERQAADGAVLRLVPSSVHGSREDHANRSRVFEVQKNQMRVIARP